MPEYPAYVIFETVPDPKEMMSQLAAHFGAELPDFSVQTYLDDEMDVTTHYFRGVEETLNGLKLLTGPFGSFALSNDNQQLECYVKGNLLAIYVQVKYPEDDLPEEADYPDWAQPYQTLIAELISFFVSIKTCPLAYIYRFSSKYGGDPSLEQIAAEMAEALQAQDALLLLELIRKWSDGYFIWMLGLNKEYWSTRRQGISDVTASFDTVLLESGQKIVLENRLLCPL